MGLPGFGRLPIGDLDQDIGIIEPPVPGAAQEPVLARSLRRDQALEHTPELVPPAGFGVQFDDHRDSHMVLSGRPWSVPVMLARTLPPDDPANRPAGLDRDG